MGTPMGCIGILANSLVFSTGIGREGGFEPPISALEPLSQGFESGAHSGNGPYSSSQTVGLIYAKKGATRCSAPRSRFACVGLLFVSVHICAFRDPATLIRHSSIIVADLLRRLGADDIRSRPRPTTILCEPDEHTILAMLKLTKNIPCRDEGDCGLAPKAVSSNTLPFAP
jgi:hypothetical protein